MEKKNRNIPRVTKKKSNFLPSSQLQALSRDIIITVYNQSKGVDSKNIRENLQLPPTYTNEINTALAALCQQGVLRRTGKKRYVIDSANVRQGTLSFHPKGFGFVSLEAEGKDEDRENDVYKG